MTNNQSPLMGGPEPSEVAGAAGAEESVAGENQETVDWEKRVDELQSSLTGLQDQLGQVKEESDRNIRRLQSTHSRQLKDLTQQHRQEQQGWENAIDTANMRNMDESERLNYENDRLAERLAKSNERIAEIEAVAQENQQKAQYFQWFVERGVPANQLNMNSLQELVDSGYTAERQIMQTERERVAKIEAENEALKQQLASQSGGKTTPQELGRKAGDLEAPPVAVTQPGETTGGARTWPEVLEGLKGTFSHVPTQEEVYRAVERELLPASVLPGLEGHPETRQWKLQEQREG